MPVLLLFFVAEFAVVSETRRVCWRGFYFEDAGLKIVLDIRLLCDFHRSPAFRSKAVANISFYEHRRLDARLSYKRVDIKKSYCYREEFWM